MDEENDDEEEEEEEERRRECTECHKELRLGFDAVAAQQGVIGPTGFVDLEDPMYFCNDECVSRYFNEHKPEKIQRRIP